jgi:hypothetical protein
MENVFHPGIDNRHPKKGGSSFGMASAASFVFALMSNEFIYPQP